MELVQKDPDTWKSHYPDKHPIYVDVNGCLIFWPGGDKERIPRPDEDGGLELGFGEYPVPNEKLIKILREMHDKGHEIIVWCRGGREHAENAVEFVGIGDIVSVCLPKPLTIIDDSWLWLTHGVKRVTIHHEYKKDNK